MLLLVFFSIYMWTNPFTLPAILHSQITPDTLVPLKTLTSIITRLYMSCDPQCWHCVCARVMWSVCVMICVCDVWWMIFNCKECHKYLQTFDCTWSFWAFWDLWRFVTKNDPWSEVIIMCFGKYEPFSVFLYIFDCVLSKVTKNEKVAFSLFLFF